VHQSPGNAYQAVRLGDEVLSGFRAKDRNVFAGIELAGKTVIDLGCNLREILGLGGSDFIL